MVNPYPGAERFMPPRRSLRAMRTAVQQCRGCPLYRNATQAVFGEGPARAPMLLVGEQPGNDEDLSGHPFVGPAGRILNQALEEAGITRADAYVSNAVKHFKWEPSGSKRLHKKPDAREIAACRPWLEQEIRQVSPQVLVCMGATAAQSLISRNFKVTQQRGHDVTTALAPHTVATIHPSAILRQRTSEDRAREMHAFIQHLRFAKSLVRPG